VGGTVGDIESMVFLESLRQFQYAEGRDQILFIHVSLVPAVGASGEQKTKPTQHSVKEFRAAGLSPDLIICRSSALLCEDTKKKISVFCDVKPSHILAVCDVSNVSEQTRERKHQVSYYRYLYNPHFLHIAMA